MASEQRAPRKKQSRNLSREEHCHPVLYRHQDCIPNPKLLQNCEKHNTLCLKNNQDSESHGRLVSQQDTNDIKSKSKQLNSKVKNDSKCDKGQQDSKKSNEQSNAVIVSNDEFSKSRKRRLRKRRLLVSLAPTLNSIKTNTPVDNNLQNKATTPSRPVCSSSVVSPVSNTLSARPTESVKSSSKESRKRLDKSVGSRNKSIKCKSLVDSANQSKAEIIKTLEEKTLNSLLQTLVPLTNTSPKKEKPPLSLFSFPEKRLNSTESKIGKDGVFYFGETKNQLEKLTTDFNKYSSNLGQEKSAAIQNNQYKQNFTVGHTPTNLKDLQDSGFRFSLKPMINNVTSTLNEKQNFYDLESGSPRNNSTVKSPPQPKTLNFHSNEFKTPVLTDLSKFPIHPVLNLPATTVCTPLPKAKNSPSSFENSGVKISSNISKPSELLHSHCSTTVSSPREELKHKKKLFEDIKISSNTMKPIEEPDKSNKSREQVLLEREAKKAAKLAAKAKHKTAQNSKVDVLKDINKSESSVPVQNPTPLVSLKTLNENSETLLPYQNTESKVKNDEAAIVISTSTLNTEISGTTKIVELKETSKPDSLPKSKAELRAERRAKQEAQRAAKASSNIVQPKSKEKPTLQVKNDPPKTDSSIGKVEKKPDVIKTTTQPKPKLFSHLCQEKIHIASHQMLQVGGLHPAVVRLGVQYAARVVVGSNARCVALLHALKQVVNDYNTPSEKEFSRGLEEEFGSMMAYLNQCRPLAVSMTNALRHTKRILTQLPNNISDVEARRKICDVIDTYINDQIDAASRQICITVKEKIANGDVILTYGCSSLVYQILVESHMSGTNFRVVVVDGLPWREGREMLRRLVDKGLSCTYVLITAASFVMREASKVLLGAHALLANGYVMSRAGSSQVALLAHCYNVPVLVCCETHKFSERVQTDAFVYNELGELSSEHLKDKDKNRVLASLTPLSLAYDITPPDLVSAVVTERAVLPCTSVPVILRIKPSESVM